MSQGFVSSDSFWCVCVTFLTGVAGETGIVETQVFHDIRLEWELCVSSFLLPLFFYISLFKILLFTTFRKQKIVSLVVVYPVSHMAHLISLVKHLI